MSRENLGMMTRRKNLPDISFNCMGKDTTNDFYIFFINHCLSLIKIYSKKLDFNRELSSAAS